MLSPGASGLTRSTYVRLPSPGGKVSQNWQAIGQVASAANAHSADIAALQGAFANQKHRSKYLDTLHPFKLYQLPSVLRTSPNPATDWLKFIVRAGRVLDVDATGTDTINADPDSEQYPTSPAEIAIPADTTGKFWFWLEIGSTSGATTAKVRYGPTPTAASYDTWTTTNPWLLAPFPDPLHVPIGWVDVHTNFATHYPIVRQLLRSDLLALDGIINAALISFNNDAVHGDYLVCRLPGGNSDGSNDIKVAIEPQLQTGITTQTTPDTSVWTYTYTTPQQRTSACTSGPQSGTSLSEYITPAFITTPPDIIPVQYCANTGVTVSSIPLHWIALTGRQWAAA